MQRIKRIITLTAITAITAASVPGIAAADKNTGSGSGSKGASKQLCDALPGIVNTLALVSGAMDPGSAAFTVVHGAQQALFDAGSKACPA